MDNSLKKFTLRVEKDCTLLELLELKLKDYTKSRLKTMLQHRQFWLNGQTALQRFDDLLEAGSFVDVHSVKQLRKKEKLQHPYIQVVFEDEFLMVVYKREGYLTVGTDKDKINTVYHVLNQYMKSQKRDQRIYVVHRLDRETSGLLIFAKSEEVQQALQKNWTECVQKRCYTAVVKGKMPEAKGLIKSYLWEDKQLRVHSSKEDKGGQLAETYYEVEKEGPTFSVVQLQLKTGRKNQIRVHLQSMGCPIVGDKKYGGPVSPIKRLCLHAGYLKFKHPITHSLMTFEWPVPSSFYTLLRK